MRFVPRKWRFTSTIFLIRSLLPFFNLLPRFKSSTKIHAIDGPIENLLLILLDVLSKNGIYYDPTLEIRGGETLKTLLGKDNKGLLIISVHGISSMIIRFLTDNDYQPKFISISDELNVPGTQLMSKTIKTSSNFLITVRKELGLGGNICAMIDGDKSSKRTVEMQARSGITYISNPLIKVACQNEANIVFCKVFIKNNRAIAVFEPPSTPDKYDSEKVTQSFINFLSKCN